MCVLRFMRTSMLISVCAHANPFYREEECISERKKKYSGKERGRGEEWRGQRQGGRKGARERGRGEGRMSP